MVIRTKPSMTLGTPRGTPVGRKPVTPDHISPSTQRHPGLVSPLTVLIGSHDDAKEKRERRRSRVMDLQTRNLLSPGSPAESRVMPLSGFSGVQLAEHYANCVQLSTENKINAKNAFGLHLIDFMTEVLKKKEADVFQVASSTLDAGAKIYAGRVDAIHTETYKVLSGLGRGSKKDKDGEGEEGAETDQDAQMNDCNVKKKKKKTRKTNMIETNLKNITINKLNLEFEVDPLFQVMSATMDDSGTSGLLLSNVGTLDDSSVLALNSKTIMSSNEPTSETESGKKPIDLKSIIEMFRGVDIQSKKICPQFADFQFLNWNQDDESLLSKTFGQSAHAFDLNAEPEPIPEMQDLSLEEDTDADHDSLGMPDDDSLRGDGQAAKFVENTLKSIQSDSSVSILMQVLASEPSDYSYFNNNLLRMWAGPSHWQLKPIPRDSKFGKTGLEKSQRSRVKKAAFVVDYEETMDFEQYFKISKAMSLTKATLMKYSSDKRTLPKDLHYDADKLFRLFLKPQILIRRQMMASEGLDDGIETYDYENAKDRENFCPADDGDDDYDNLSENTGFKLDNGNASQDLFSPETSHDIFSCTGNESLLDGTLLSGDRLVAQPNKVARIDIAYAKAAKRIDVRRLKATMWKILTKPEEDKENQDANIVNENDTRNDGEKSLSAVKGTVSFKSIMDVLPSKVSLHMAQNLSVPIAFVCLLHLCNEKTLKLEDIDMEDLLICQGI